MRLWDAINLLSDLAEKITSKQWKYAWSENLNTMRQLQKEIRQHQKEMSDIIKPFDKQGLGVIHSFAMTLLNAVKEHE